MKLKFFNKCTPASLPTPISYVYLNEGEYYGKDYTLSKYLETLERPPDMHDNKFKKLRAKSKHFFVRDGVLYKWNHKRGSPPRRVIGTQRRKREVIKALHDDIGHRG